MRNSEEKIKELQAQHEAEIKGLKRETKLKAMFPFAKRVSEVWKGPFTVIEVRNSTDAKKVIKAINPVKKDWKIDHKETYEYRALYKVTIDSPVNRYATVKLEFNDKEGYRYWLEIPVNEVNQKMINITQRGVTSSEYHYFPQTSRAQLDRIRINKYTLASHSILLKNIGWYGGDTTVIAKDINKIVSDLLK